MSKSGIDGPCPGGGIKGGGARFCCSGIRAARGPILAAKPGRSGIRGPGTLGRGSPGLANGPAPLGILIGFVTGSKKIKNNFIMWLNL